MRTAVRLAGLALAAVALWAAAGNEADNAAHPNGSRGHREGPYERHVKRPLDAALAAAALVALSPVMAATAVAVRLSLGSPVLFRQERPGRDGAIFPMWKFRSMSDARDANGDPLPDADRLTPFGAWLRSTSLDELPELVSILRGDMAVVGPRPLLVRYLPYYTEEERRRHDVRPGLTGLAQVSGRNLINWPERFALDVDYVDDITFVGDARIVLATARKVLLREDVATDTDTVETYLDVERAKARGVVHAR